MIKALLVYPEFPVSYWSGKYAVQFAGKKAALPPLGLATLAALFPRQFELRLVDMNVEPLTDDDLDWADMVFLSAMIVQKDSFHEVAARCRSKGVPVAAGGPYATAFREELHEIDHLILGEAETHFGEFLADLEKGTLKRLYQEPHDDFGNVLRPGMRDVPVPRFDLLKLDEYVSMAMQYSRGCPHNCEFCNVTELFGRRTRTKSIAQVISEMERLWELHWRGPVFFVDDNFIGNRRETAALLPAMADFQRRRGFPFTFFTEATVNLADRPDLMDAMAEAGFNMVFLGIETPNAKVLTENGKAHNVNSSNPEYLSWAVQEIQRHGMEVTAGFIVGFDGDDESCFDSQFNFIQKNGIACAMVGILTPFKDTRLHARLKREGRLLDESAGDNVTIALRFVPTMSPETLLRGYRRLLTSLYDPTLSNYFERAFNLIRNWNLRTSGRRKLTWKLCRGIVASFCRQLFSREGGAYARFLGRVLLQHPRMLGEALRLAVYGHHFQKVTRQLILVDDFRRLAAKEAAAIRPPLGCEQTAPEALQTAVARVSSAYAQIAEDFRPVVREAYERCMQCLRLQGSAEKNPPLAA